MLRSPQFLIGLGVGAVVAWIVAGRQAPALVAATPYIPKLTRRTPRRGGGWSGRPRG